MRSFLLVWIIIIDSKSRDSYEKKEVKVLTWSQDQGTIFRYSIVLDLGYLLHTILHMSVMLAQCIF